METMIVALITSIATIIGAMLVYNFKIKTIFKNTEEIKGFKDFFDSEHKGRSNEHKDLSNEHKDLSNEHKDLSNEHSDLEASIKESVNKIEHRIIEFVSKDDVRYDNLTEKQKDIVTTVTNVQAMANEIKYLALENKELLKENKDLIMKLDKSYEQVKELKNEVREIQQKVRSREMER